MPHAACRMLYTTGNKAKERLVLRLFNLQNDYHLWHGIDLVKPMSDSWHAVADYKAQLVVRTDVGGRREHFNRKSLSAPPLPTANTKRQATNQTNEVPGAISASSRRRDQNALISHTARAEDNVFVIDRLNNCSTAAHIQPIQRQEEIAGGRSGVQCELVNVQ
ncbi:unnamed protein product [Ceratitis capitata]|uniref:(Mediterranean fruit fly) hypothetical protein n=1 Tax=Ceratitis capitata TaxID=7213 RepID=A0A811V1N7_CERCA|nr:unnamed protein product [Ceratitis capitata]